MLERRALAVALLFFAIASVYRAVHFAITGFFVPDEYGYALAAWRGDVPYQDRNFFNVVNIALFQLFRISSVDRLVAIMPFYFIMWIAIGILSAYKICRSLGFNGNALSATLMLSLTIPVFALFSPSFLTEPVSFAMVMLGLFLTTRFVVPTPSRWRYTYPLVAALCFVAAAYTRIDFAIYQMGGFVPFLYSEIRRLRTSSVWRSQVWKTVAFVLLFVVPAVLFLYYPQRPASGVAAAIGSTVNPPSTVTNPPQPSMQFLFLLPNTFHIFAIGLLLGYTPVYAILITVPFLMLLYSTAKSRGRHSFINLWLAILGLGTFLGTCYVFSIAIDSISLSTIIRFSYDMVPAFFLLAPVLLLRLKNRKGYALIVVGLLTYGVAVAASYQSYLQTNLGGAYPFPSGNDPLLTLQYRTPYAQIRDYFAQLPQNQEVVIIGEARTTYGHNTNSLPQDWRFTPGVAKLTNIVILPYLSSPGLAKVHPSEFYLYIEKGGDTYFNATNAYLLEIRNGTYATSQANWQFKVTQVTVIFDIHAFYLAKVALSYNP